MSMQDKLASLPMEPGCYLMKDQQGQIIYVGKAKKLKNRVNDYFTGAHDYKTTKLVSLIHDFDIIVTDTEKESLILEINLIKKHRPRFNIMFMDDKSYPYIKITQEKYPRLSVVRELKKDKKANYYGPFPDASAAHNMATLLNSIYPLRKCRSLPKKVCLYYHLGQCLGPCEFPVEATVYPEMLKEIIQVLKGDDQDLRKRLTAEMQKATDALNYEKAIEYRDYLRSLDHINDKQNVNQEARTDRDAFNYYEKDGVLTIAALIVRGGQLMDRHLVSDILVEDAHESFEQFILQYYDKQVKPKELLLPFGMNVRNLEEILEIKIHQPQRGELRQLMELVLKNAMNYHRQYGMMIQRNQSKQDKALEDLASLLSLSEVSTIELVDNSHTQGQLATSAVVVFKQGKAYKQDYRIYHLHNNADDVRNMEEVIYRRYLKMLKEDKTFPSVLLVDGGFLQIQGTLRSLELLDVNIPVFGLVKDEKHQTSALMDSNGDRIELKDSIETFYLLTRMQDEVHRFVLSQHQKRRSKAQTYSVLDDVEGVGPKRKQALLKRFKSVKGILEASEEQLIEVLGPSLAKIIQQRIQAKQEMV